MTISISKLIFYSLLPGGPLLARIFDLNGSVDQAWLFFPIFFLFPFSLVPMFMMYFNKIKEGSGGKVFDIYVWIPIVVKLFLHFVGSEYLPEKQASLLTAVLMTASIMFAKYLHNKKSCEISNRTIDSSTTKFTILSYDALFENGISNFAPVIVNLALTIVPILPFILMFIPFLSDMLELIVWILTYLCVYTIHNMFQHIDMNKFCNPTSSSSDTIKGIIGILLSIASAVSSPFI